MKLIYIEVSKEEIAENKTIASAINEVVSGFCSALIDIKPVLNTYELKKDNEE